MTVSKTTWIILLVSVIVALIVMVVAFVILRIKVNKVKNKYLAEEAKARSEMNKALVREGHGELLWDLKSNSEMPLGDLEMELMINTYLRNEYKSVKLINFKSEYEATTMKKLAKAKVLKSAHTDLTIIDGQFEFENVLKDTMSKLKEKQMIAIMNMPRPKKRTKSLLKQLKENNIRHDWTSTGQGIVFIVK